MNKPISFKVVCVAGVAFLIVQSQIVFSAEQNAAQKTISPDKRDPFWPVGYVPEDRQEKEPEPVKQVVPTGTEQWQTAMKQVVINGVSSRSEGGFFAVINGQVKSVGEKVEVSYGGRTFVWVVESIKPPGSVKLRRQSVR